MKTFILASIFVLCAVYFTACQTPHQKFCQRLAEPELSECLIEVETDSAHLEDPA